jgi:hypothetical protein
MLGKYEKEMTLKLPNEHRQFIANNQLKEK